MANGMRVDSRQIRGMPLGIQEQVAIQLIGKTSVADMLPAVPGTENLYDIAEMSFHNGEAHRSEQFLQILLERKSKAKGEVHEELSQLVQIVRRL